MARIMDTNLKSSNTREDPPWDLLHSLGMEPAVEAQP